jgi:hypothetical protein
MPTFKQPKSEVQAFGDHERITPDTSKLRRAVRIGSPRDPDPVKLAEQALGQLSAEFDDWMRDECERLDAARQKVRTSGLSADTRQELFLAAHDIKGDSVTFGYPEAMPAADSLCRLLEHAPDLGKIPLSVVDRHVDAVRAIVREHGRSDIAAMAAALNGKLKQVTDEFLIAENKHRPEVLRTIMGSPPDGGS